MYSAVLLLFLFLIYTTQREMCHQGGYSLAASVQFTNRITFLAAENPNRKAEQNDTYRCYYFTTSVVF